LLLATCSKLSTRSIAAVYLNLSAPIYPLEPLRFDLDVFIQQRALVPVGEPALRSVRYAHAAKAVFFAIELGYRDAFVAVEIMCKIDVRIFTRLLAIFRSSFEFNSMH